MEYRIGCSGWSYQHWKDNFYPRKLPQSRWFEHYASRFDTVELNNTFYRLPTMDAVTRWKESAPPGFTFAVKASRLITHYRRLTNVERALKTFYSRIDLLGETLGPVLYQLPERSRRDDARLAEFLECLPERRLHVFEFRHESWWSDEVYALLRKHDAAFCIWHMGQKSTPMVATTPELYIRFHGVGSGARGYGEKRLREWVERIEDVRGVRGRTSTTTRAGTRRATRCA